MAEYLRGHESLNNRFFITIKNGENVFGNFDKFEFNLNTSRNIGDQAENLLSSILDSFDIPDSSRENFSWKIFRGDGSRYMMVSQSKNWDPNAPG